MSVVGVSDPSLCNAEDRSAVSDVAERALVLLLVLVSILIVSFCVGVIGASSCGDRSFDNLSGSVVVFSLVDVVVGGGVGGVVVVVGSVGGDGDGDGDADADADRDGDGDVDDEGDGGGVDVDVVVDGVVDVVVVVVVVVGGGARSVVAAVPFVAIVSTICCCDRCSRRL